jgi:3-hydroxybutyryl-CoA dehydratase
MRFDKMSQVGKTYGEFKMGEIDRGPAVTITESHINMFTAISGDYNPLHTNEEFAKKTQYGTRIAHGLLSLSITSGYIGRLLAGTAIAFLGAKYRFTAPVKIGDTIYAESEVVEKKDKEKYNGGKVTVKMRIKNQRDEVCIEGEAAVLVSNVKLW